MPDIIIKEKRKSFTMSIDYDAKIILKAPKNASDGVIEQFVKAHQAWLIKHLEIKKSIKTQYEDFFACRELLLLGKAHCIKCDSAVKSIKLTEHLKVPEKYFDGVVLSSLGVGAIGRWLKKKAEAYLSKRLDEYAERLGYEYNQMKIINGKSRWGSCNSKREIAFNYRVVMLPVEIADYIIIHELCHLNELNHSSKFWANVEKILPDYKKYRKTLKEYNWMQKLFR